MGDHSYLAVFNHRETGADMEYIGADGHYGLGRVMICEENQPEPEMTVLSWVKLPDWEQNHITNGEKLCRQRNA